MRSCHISDIWTAKPRAISFLILFFVRQRRQSRGRAAMDLSSQLMLQTHNQQNQQHHHHHHVHLSRRPRRRPNGPQRTIHPLLLSDPSRLQKKQKKKTSFSIPDPPSPPPAVSVQRPRMQACSVGEESDEGNPSQQQAVLESLASYLEGELLSRLQSYSDLLVENHKWTCPDCIARRICIQKAEGISRERSFYCAKLLQIEKVCKHVQPFKANITKLDTVLSILSTNVDMPFV